MATNAGSKIELAEDSYPLSPMQQGMLFHNLRAPEAGTDICQIVADLPEEIDAALFEQAWQHLAEHHPILQTSFSWEGEPRQHVRSEEHTSELQSRVDLVCR